MALWFQQWLSLPTGQCAGPLCYDLRQILLQVGGGVAPNPRTQSTPLLHLKSMPSGLNRDRAPSHSHCCNQLLLLCTFGSCPGSSGVRGHWTVKILQSKHCWTRGTLLLQGAMELECERAE
ncbi:hypothetical protein CEXT_211071 [Caerostris extrusa]|uniref:Uncharacterized protein n=1 Tax=Caerostris extrusa TaxID=172846 RepID=A0AAV4M6U2_CAEEX|nr:hypothetical protein CEXT_211071 [Caerostris extrusa]